jgi:pimeloyl-ACP methyl ester carboxylesterase
LPKNNGEARTFSAVSPDGSEIACEVAGLEIGRGPALVLIHGTADDRQGFDRLAPLLADKYTLYMMDRRGRGLSTRQAAPYAIEREFEDINALADAIAQEHNAPTGVFAHSYGALCTMGAARTATRIGRIMLYEPPPGTPSTLVDRMVEANNAGDLEGVMHVQFVELQHLPQSQFDRLKSDPTRWARYLGFAGTIAREFVNARRFSVTDGEFADRDDVRFIVGEKTFPPLAKYTETARRAFPHADKHIIPGQGHNALRQAPELVAAEIEKFFI